MARTHATARDERGPELWSIPPPTSRSGERPWTNISFKPPVAPPISKADAKMSWLLYPMERLKWPDSKFCRLGWSPHPCWPRPWWLGSIGTSPGGTMSAPRVASLMGVTASALRTSAHMRRTPTPDPRANPRRFIDQSAPHRAERPGRGGSILER